MNVDKLILLGTVSQLRKGEDLVKSETEKLIFLTPSLNEALESSAMTFLRLKEILTFMCTNKFDMV